MKQIGVLSAVVVGATLVLPRLVAAQTAPAIPPSITTPDRVETRIGTLDFRDGAPSKATLDKVYDDIDFAHAQRVFADTLQGGQPSRDPQGPAERRRQGQRGHHLLRVDGRQVAVADHQCGYDLRRWRARSHQGSHGDPLAAPTTPAHSRARQARTPLLHRCREAPRHRPNRRWRRTAHTSAAPAGAG